MQLILSREPAHWTVKESKVNTAVHQMVVSEALIKNRKWPPPRKLNNVARIVPHLRIGNITWTSVVVLFFCMNASSRNLGWRRPCHDTRWQPRVRAFAALCTGEGRVYHLLGSVTVTGYPGESVRSQNLGFAHHRFADSRNQSYALAFTLCTYPCPVVICVRALAFPLSTQVYYLYCYGPCAILSVSELYSLQYQQSLTGEAYPVCGPHQKCPACGPHQTCHVAILDWSWRSMSGICSTPNMPRGKFWLDDG